MLLRRAFSGPAPVPVHAMAVGVEGDVAKCVPAPLHGTTVEAGYGRAAIMLVGIKQPVPQAVTQHPAPNIR